MNHAEFRERTWQAISPKPIFDKHRPQRPEFRGTVIEPGIVLFGCSVTETRTAFLRCRVLMLLLFAPVFEVQPIRIAYPPPDIHRRGTYTLTKVLVQLVCQILRG